MHHLNAAPHQTPVTLVANSASGLPQSAADRTLDAAISETRYLWDSVTRSLRSARESLYEFLGATYEHASSISQNPSALRELRLLVRREYTSDRHKKRVEGAHAEELLLANALGTGAAQQSLRSKYKKLLAKASEASVPRERDAFKDWLAQNGGIVDALKGAIDAPRIKATRPLPIRSFESCAGDLLRDRKAKPIEERIFANDLHDGFALVLFYVDPSTKEARMMAELTDAALIEDAVRIASERVTPLPHADAA